MPFGRRSPKSIWRRVREVVWPRSGLRRAWTYLAHRVRRLPGTPYSIAAGLACGAAVSFTPFMGLHFILGALLALLIRGNVVASAIGTAAGNPWTFPFIWSGIYGLGHALLGGAARNLPDELTLSFVFDNPLGVLYPMIVGGALIGSCVWLVTFALCYTAVSRYQAARRERRRLGRRRRVSVSPSARGDA